MSGKIFMIKTNDELIAMNEKKHTSELNFQNLIKKYPDLIPGDQIDSENPRKWLFVGEEVHFPIVGGRTIRLDLLLLDQDGVPTLVELKRSEDDRLKSEVATQIMEYGANILLSMDTLSIRKMVESNDENAVISFLEDENEDEFWEKVYDNLKAEKIRLLVVADEVPTRLQNIIEFLNRNMESVMVLAIEIKQYIKDDTKTLVSRVIGQSIEAQSKKIERIGSSSILDKETLFENLDSYGKEFYQKVFKLIENLNLKINYTNKGFTVYVPVNGTDVSIFRGYSKLAAHGQHIVSTSGNITKIGAGDGILDEYVKEILKIDGAYKAGNGFVLKIDKNIDKENWEKFKNTISHITEQISKNGLIK